MISGSDLSEVILLGFSTVLESLSVSLSKYSKNYQLNSLKKEYMSVSKAVVVFNSCSHTYHVKEHLTTDQLNQRFYAFFS